ncbi:MAG TPA: sigma factor [Rhizomicrobium sp.]|nr:sigma factor [Rhizomicrobium sp.]
MKTSDLETWFVREVLPLEAALMQFLQHNWRNQSDIADLRQDVYERVCLAAQEQLPDNAKAFVFRTARNLLVDRIRREHVVPIEAVEDVDALSVAMEEPGPERAVIARVAAARPYVRLQWRIRKRDDRR